MNPLKFMFSKKDTKIRWKLNGWFDIMLQVYQIEDEDFVNFCGLLRQHEL